MFQKLRHCDTCNQVKCCTKHGRPDQSQRKRTVALNEELWEGTGSKCKVLWEDKGSNFPRFLPSHSASFLPYAPCWPSTFYLLQRECIQKVPCHWRPSCQVLNTMCLLRRIRIWRSYMSAARWVINHHKGQMSLEVNQVGRSRFCYLFIL